MVSTISSCQLKKQSRGCIEKDFRRQRSGRVVSLEQSADFQDLHRNEDIKEARRGSVVIHHQTGRVSLYSCDCRAFIILISTGELAFYLMSFKALPEPMRWASQLLSLHDNPSHGRPVRIRWRFSSALNE